MPGNLPNGTILSVATIATIASDSTPSPRIPILFPRTGSVETIFGGFLASEGPSPAWKSPVRRPPSRLDGAARLDKLDIADDTIVVFTSDHGEMFGSQGRMFKLTFYDEAARIPLLFRYPEGVKSGVSDVCINTPDIMPTLLGLVGLSADIPKDVDGCGRVGA